MGFRWTLALGCALLASGCRVPELLSPEVVSPVEVRGAQASFPTDGRGRFGVDLEVGETRGAGQLTSAYWEVWLGGRWFAAGVQPVDQPLSAHGPTRLHLELPVAFDQKVVPGPAALELGLGGYLDVLLGQDARRWSFHRHLSVHSDGAPRLGPPGARSREE